MKQSGKYLAVLLIAITAFNGTAQAVDNQESSVVTVGKSTFYGALTGLLVGGAAALVSGGSSGEILKWSFVGGTAGGFIWGVHDVSTRPEQSAAVRNGPRILDSRLSVFCPHILRPDHAATGHITLPA